MISIESAGYKMKNFKNFDSSIDSRKGTAMAFGLLLMVDVILNVGGFRRLHTVVRRWPKGKGTEVDEATARLLAGAVDRAIAIYFKQVLCLQRSAAMACMLRLHGIPAELVIGAQKLPFLAHAWVELDGTVLNDGQRVQQRCMELERL